MKFLLLEIKLNEKISPLLLMIKSRGLSWVLHYSLLMFLSITFSKIVDFYFRLKFREKLGKKFIFRGKKIPYFIHPYNRTYLNERTIEIPLVLEYIKKFKSRDTFEVGNVLSNYFKSNHLVLDYYEKAQNVINQDIIKFKTRNRYKLIFSISTLEHVGVDFINNPRRSVIAVKKLTELLVKDGMLVFTIPLGYNKYLDKVLLSNKIKLSEKFVFQRISSENKWIQVNINEPKNFIYGFPYRWGNYVLLGIIKK